MKCHFAILQLVFVFASCQQYGNLRMKDLESYYNGDGLLQIYLQGTWVPVCSENFDEAAAATACRQMGYTTFDRFILNTELPASSDSSYVTQCPAQEDYINHGLLHILRCNGYTQQSNCSEGGVHLYCIGSSLDNPYNGQVFLSTTVYFNSSGVLKLYYNNKPLSVCCDDTYFNKFAADSACRQLGYTKALSFDLHQARDSSWNIGGTCDESYSCLKSCSDKYPVQLDCQPCNVTCIFDTSDEKKYSSGSQAECMIDIDDNSFQITTGIFVSLFIMTSVVSTVIIIWLCCKLFGRQRRNNVQDHENIQDDQGNQDDNQDADQNRIIDNHGVPNAGYGAMQALAPIQ